jgi:hypothetical protein
MLLVDLIIPVCKNEHAFCVIDAAGKKFYEIKSSLIRPMNVFKYKNDGALLMA